MECLTEFACFVAGEINQVIEAMPGSVVPLAMFSFKFAFSDLLQIGSKFGHCVTFLVICIVTLPWNALLTTTWHIYITVSNLVMRCYHLHICPPDDTTCASCKVGHLMAPLALVTKLSTRWRHIVLDCPVGIISWY